MKVSAVRFAVLAAIALLAAMLAACGTDDIPATQGPVATPVPTPMVDLIEPTATAVAQAASSTATPRPAPTATPDPAARITAQLQGVPGIVDATNLGWPRQARGLNGVIEIPAKPLRIITASVGHDEVVLALVPDERLVAVGNATKSETFSNVAAHTQDKPEITRDPETIIAHEPDVVVTSPFFTADLVEALDGVGIPTIQTQLEQDPEARLNNILLIGYILGEEERALAFREEVRERYEAVVRVTVQKEQRPRVLAVTSYGDDLWVAGDGSTEGGVIEAAGGLNAAADAGVQGNQTTGLEGLIAMNPEIIIIPQPIEFGAEEFRQRLLTEEALTETPAITQNRVYIVDGKHFTTLSHWNIRGAEDLARILWPNDFPDPPADSFSLTE